MTAPRLATITAVLILLLPGKAFSGFGSSCFEPSSPSCVSYMGMSDDEFTFQMCRDKVARFSNEVNEYIQCRLNEAESEYNEKLSQIKTEAMSKKDEANRAIRRFNCYAKGERFCP